MGHPKHLDGSVDKGNDFIDSGMTLITEVESEKYLKLAEKRKKAKKQQTKIIPFLSFFLYQKKKIEKRNR